MTGKFLVIEGIDGSGKTTLINKISERLTERGIKHLAVREPGGTPICEDIRKLIKTPHRGDALLPLSELLLFYASRHQHVENVIKPAMARGELVICDRFDLSTWAYQGHGRGLSYEVELLSHLVLKDFKPHRTFYIDVPADVAISRQGNRGYKDVIEQEGLAFFEQVREYYLQTAQTEGDIIVCNGIYQPETVFEDLWELVEPFCVNE